MPTWYASQPPASLNEGGINAGVHQAPDWLSVLLWASESLCWCLHVLFGVCSWIIISTLLQFNRSHRSTITPLVIFYKLTSPYVVLHQKKTKNNASLTRRLVPHLCSVLTSEAVDLCGHHDVIVFTWDSRNTIAYIPPCCTFPSQYRKASQAQQNRAEPVRCLGTRPPSENVEASDGPAADGKSLTPKYLG